MRKSVERFKSERRREALLVSFTQEARLSGQLSARLPAENWSVINARLDAREPVTVSGKTFDLAYSLDRIGYLERLICNLDSYTHILDNAVRFSHKWGSQGIVNVYLPGEREAQEISLTVKLLERLAQASRDWSEQGQHWTKTSAQSAPQIER